MSVWPLWPTLDQSASDDGWGQHWCWWDSKASGPPFSLFSFFSLLWLVTLSNHNLQALHSTGWLSWGTAGWVVKASQTWQHWQESHTILIKGIQEHLHSCNLVYLILLCWCSCCCRTESKQNMTWNMTIHFWSHWSQCGWESYIQVSHVGDGFAFCLEYTVLLHLFLPQV